MLQRLSALSLLILLTLLVGAKNLALGYCFCEKAFFVGDVPCANSVPTADDQCDCSDCGLPHLPSGECFVTLQFEVDDYLWSLDNEHEASPTVAGLPQALGPPASSFFRVRKLVLPTMAFEPPPPLGPLFQRHCELLL